MKKNYLLLCLSSILICFSAKAQVPSEDEMEFAKNGNLATPEVTIQNLNGIKNNDASKVLVVAGCDSLETTYLAGNGIGGAMFDIVALKSLTIEYFYINLSVGISGFRIYYKTGTYDGSQADSTQWTFLGADTVNALTTNSPTLIPIPINLSMSVGDTLAFYMTRIGSGSVRYTNGSTVNTLYKADSALAFYEGIGVVFPFGNTFTPRVWNGTIKYCVGPVGIQNNDKKNQLVKSYFNSSAEQIVIEVSDELSKVNSNLQFTLTDIFGKKVLCSKIESGSNRFSTANLAKGVYVSSITNGNTKFYQTKLVIY